VPTTVPTSAPVRLQSLDVFRGVTMAAMVIVNNPGDWGNVYPPLLHAEWHGCTPTDLVFPFFLFIVGFAITLSRKSGRWVSLLRRALTIVALGWFLAGFPRFNLGTLRIPGVLPRIGLCYLAAASLYHVCTVRGATLSQEARDRLTARVASIAAAVLLLGYWAILMLVPGASGTPGDLTPEGNIGAVIDRALMQGHLWKANWDPEGLLSTLPAIGTTLIGVLTGLWFRNAGALTRKAVGLAAGGTALALLGLAWGLVFPLNKALWTSSYAVFTAGLGAMLLGACVWFVDVRGWRRVAYPFVVLGTNAIALFVLSGLIAKTLGLIKLTAEDGTVRSLKTVIYQGAFVPLASPINASLLFAIANLAVLYGVLWVMYKRGIFLKV
jgi:predicted acyltransferase